MNQPWFNTVRPVLSDWEPITVESSETDQSPVQLVKPVGPVLFWKH